MLNRVVPRALRLYIEAKGFLYLVASSRGGLAVSSVTQELNQTIGQLLWQRSEEYPNQEAAVFPDEGVRWTYRELFERASLVARALLGLGVQRGEHVAVWTTNKKEWLELQFATGMIGAVLVTVNTNYKLLELEYLLKQSDTTTLVLMPGFKDSNYLETLYTLCPELRTAQPGKLQSAALPRLKNVIFLGDHFYPGLFTWQHFLNLASTISAQDFAAREGELCPTDIINIQYTSGTTGFPKGAMLSHRNIIGNAIRIAQRMNLTSQDRLCIPVPFFHCFGCVLGILAAVTQGSTIVALDYFSPRRTLETIEAERCTAVHGVPTMFITMLEHPLLAKTDLSSLRTGIMAGSSCPEEVMTAVIDKMGITEITIAYGQTEAAPVITQTTVNDSFQRRVSTVGKPLPGVEVKVVDPETNLEVGPGVTGELCTRGFHVMQGYYNDPAATAQVIDSDGWLHTGDLAVQDADGYFQIVGRLRDMIIRGGENIYPREIEEFLHKHPKVSEAQVVSVPSLIYGEEVFAFVKLKKSVEATEHEILEFLRKRISRHKVPSYIRFVSEFPLTASGKVQKFKLQDLARQLLPDQEEKSVTA